MLEALKEEVLEAIARMARLTEQNLANLNPGLGRGDTELPRHVAEKFHQRRHDESADYGRPKA